jgi:nucleotide-binding universal stress UspA family protein
MRLPDLRLVRRRARRFARRAAAIRYRSIVVPLLGREETEHAIDLACRLAADRGAHVVLVAPLIVPQELPLDAHFDAELAELRGRLDHATAIADSYGVGVTRRIVRTREGALGVELADVAHDHRAELLVVGAPVESRRGFRRPFPPEILSIVRDAPSRVMIVTGPVAARTRAPSAGALHASGTRSHGALPRPRVLR